MTILEFANTVKEATKSSSEIMFIQPQDKRIKDDPQVRRPDISKAKALLGWEPNVPLADGLDKTIPYFRNRLSV
jgi:nucleoside-diphosphate-sugar epimerase